MPGTILDRWEKKGPWGETTEGNKEREERRDTAREGGE